jgi:hypothetical protein
LDLFDLLITFGVVIFIAMLVVFVTFLAREFDNSRHFFAAVAKRYRGRTLRIPLGAAYRLERGQEVKVQAFSGNVLYSARIRLREDPGIYITRRYRGFRILDALTYSFGRKGYRFDSPVDEQYTFRAKDERKLREIFQPDLLEMMLTQGRVTALQIRRNRFRGALMIIRFSPDEIDKAEQSIEILNEVVRRVGP